MTDLLINDLKTREKATKFAKFQISFIALSYFIIVVTCNMSVTCFLRNKFGNCVIKSHFNISNAGPDLLVSLAISK